MMMMIAFVIALSVCIIFKFTFVPPFLVMSDLVVRFDCPGLLRMGEGGNSFPATISSSNGTFS